MMVESIRRLNQWRNKLFKNACWRHPRKRMAVTVKHQTSRLRTVDLNEPGQRHFFERCRTPHSSEPPDLSHGEVQPFVFCIFAQFSISINTFLDLQSLRVFFLRNLADARLDQYTINTYKSVKQQYKRF